MSFSSIVYPYYKRLYGVLLTGFIFFQVYFGIIPGWTSIRSDFPNYYVSSRLLFEQKDSLQLYNNEWFQEQIHAHGMDAPGKFAPFPPPTAFIMAPLAVFPPLLAKRIWLLVNIGFIGIIAVMIQKICDFDFRNSLLLILSTGMALANTLMLGQVYLLLLLSMLWAYLLLQTKKEILPGILAGAGIAIKYFPVIFLPALIYLKKWRTIFALGACIILLNIVAWIIFGSKVYLDFFNSVFFQHLSGKLEGQSPWSPSFQSWNALAYNLFKYHPVENPEPLIQSDTLFLIFQFGIIAAIMTFTIWLFSILKNNSHFVENSIILSSFTVLFLTPAGASYHNLLLLLPLTLYVRVAKTLVRNHDGHWLILLFCTILIGLLPLVQSRFHFISSGLFLSFSRLWLNAIMYITIVHWLLKFNKTDKNKSIYSLPQSPGP